MKGTRLYWFLVDSVYVLRYYTFSLVEFIKSGFEHVFCKYLHKLQNVDRIHYHCVNRIVHSKSEWTLGVTKMCISHILLSLLLRFQHTKKNVNYKSCVVRSIEFTCLLR